MFDSVFSVLIHPTNVYLLSIYYVPWRQNRGSGWGIYKDDNVPMAIARDNAFMQKPVLFKVGGPPCVIEMEDPDPLA